MTGNPRMTGGPRNWEDLMPRLATAVALIVVGGGAIMLGGAWFTMLAAVCVGLMIWELACMIAPDETKSAYVLGLIAASSVMSFFILAPPLGWLAVLLVPALGALVMRRDRPVFALYSLAVVVTGVGLISLRADQGLQWMFWLVSVVVVTDIAGYFTGRFIGGPKFWPNISPKKTWSGTVAGWVGAAIVGALFIGPLGVGVWIIGVSVLASFASQIGDIAQSAIKRRCGVKDSSALLPGHGGLLDRFDGLIGATLLAFAAFQICGFSAVAG